MDRNRIPLSVSGANNRINAGIRKTIDLLNRSIQDPENTQDGYAFDVALKSAIETRIYQLYKLQILVDSKVNNAAIARAVGVSEKTLRSWRDCDQTATLAHFVKLNRIYDQYKKRLNGGKK